MAKEQTEKSRYPSRYSPGGFVTEAQYIIELVCEQAAIKRKIELPIKFWNLKEWQLIFKAQMRATHALLKKYSGKAIIKIIKEKRIDNLRPKWVESLIENEQFFMDAAIKPVEENTTQLVVTNIENVKLRPERQVKNKLADLDF